LAPEGVRAASKGAGHENGITYVGIDAHKKDLFVAMLTGHEKTPVAWTVPNEPNAVKRLVRKLERVAAGSVRCCYEAGPGGYALQRRMTTARLSCQVIAPALIPRKPGDRIKTNRRDARKLAELLRAGLLTEVHISVTRRRSALDRPSSPRP
jgi:transposase